MLACSPMKNPTPVDAPATAAATIATPAAIANKRNKDNERPLVEDNRF